MAGEEIMQRLRAERDKIKATPRLWDDAVWNLCVRFALNFGFLSAEQAAELKI